jgi:hypothetical protein
MLVSNGWRLIFHVSDVDRFWAYLMEKGFYPDSPHDASWVNVIFICPILMAMSFHLLVRSSLRAMRLKFHGGLVQQSVSFRASLETKLHR